MLAMALVLRLNFDRTNQILIFYYAFNNNFMQKHVMILNVYGVYSLKPVLMALLLHLNRKKSSLVTFGKIKI